jgi:hypothetical protein
MTAEQLAALKRYARLEIGLGDIRRALRGLVEFNFEPENRWIDQHFSAQKPGIPVTREHIQNALAKKRLGQVGERDLVYWASMLLMNDAYEFDSRDEDFITNWLNDISYNLDPTLDRSYSGAFSVAARHRISKVDGAAPRLLPTTPTGGGRARTRSRICTTWRGTRWRS